jgi:hypothetical protein
MKISILSAFLCIGFVASCNSDATKPLQMEPVQVLRTIKTSTGLIVQYRIPKAPEGWHCAGANLNQQGDQFRLSFIAVHDADDGTKVDLPAESSKIPGTHQVHVPLQGITKFSLFVDGKHEGDFELGR